VTARPRAGSPPAFRARDACEADYAFFARLFPELGVPDPTPSPARFAETIVPGAMVLCDEVGPVGYAWGRPRGAWFHVVHVIVDPAKRRAGAGGALMAGLASRARAAGFDRWMLNVKRENAAARALYESCGMAVAHESVSMRVRWLDVERLPSAAEVAVGPVAEVEEARYEHALGLPSGEIASRRSLGRVVAGAESAGQPVGFVGYDAELPGASPFRVRAPVYARAILDWLRATCARGHGPLLVFVEGDPALEAALTAAGARPEMRALQMRGEIPPAHRR